MTTLQLLRTNQATLPAPKTRLISTWVKVRDEHGRPRLEMRWAAVPFVHLNAA